MSDINEKDINEKIVYILKRNKNTNIFETDFVTIEDTFPDFNEKFLDNYKDKGKLIDLAEKEDVCDFIQKTYDICRVIGNPSAIITKKDLNNLYDVKDFLLGRKQAFLLKQTFSKCINDGVLICSHRYRGWLSPTISLNNDFNAEIATNFGFGNASYFCSILIYKNIPIIPYSHYVLYRGIDSHEMIRCTCDYPVGDIYWKYALDYIRDFCNNYISGDDSFIKKYFLEQCNKMIDGLNYFLYSNKFDLYANLDIGPRLKNDRCKDKECINLHGHELVEFRGEKIAGALLFIDSLKVLNELIETQTYIDKIILYCNKVLPMLKEDLKILLKELDLLNNDLKNIEPEYDFALKEKLKSDEEFYEWKKKYYQVENEYKKKYIEEIIINGFKDIKLEQLPKEKYISWNEYILFGKIEQEEIQRCLFFYLYRGSVEEQFKESFDKNNPEYVLFLVERNTMLEKYDKISRMYNDLKEKKRKNENFKFNIEKYRDTIEEYFKSKNHINN